VCLRRTLEINRWSSCPSHPTISAATAKALADAPSWLDPDKTLEAMTLRKKRTPSQVCQDNFDSKAKRSYYGDQYSNSFKKATIELSDSLNDDSLRGRRGNGAKSIAATFNKSMLSSPSNRKIKATTLREAVAFDRVGLSPAKRGRPEKIPSILCAALSKQSAMMQMVNEGEASSVKMKALTEGLVAKTKWQGVFNTEYCWRKTRKNHPEILNPVKAKVRGSPCGMVVIQEHYGLDHTSGGVSHFNWNGKGQSWNNL